MSGNGKVLREKLLRINGAKDLPGHSTSRILKPGIPTASEDILLEVAKNVLKVDLRLRDNLVEHGMNSIRMLIFQRKVRTKLKVQIPSHAVFDHPTIAQMAKHFFGESTDAPSLSSRETEELTQPGSSEPLAVSAVASRLPCRLDQLANGVNCVARIPLTRFDVEEYGADEPAMGTYAKHGAFVSAVERFDHKFFNIAWDEASSMDPQQRLALEAGAHALWKAGSDRQSSDIGVYVGQMNYDRMVATEAPAPYGSTGVAPSITANRISFVHDLRGPSLVVDTACSASLVAVDVARQRGGEALVLGVHVLLTPDMYLHACKVRMLSPSGRCATFDESADGFVRGEGVAALFLSRRPLPKPCLLGTSSNQNGASAGLTKPRCEAQKALIDKGLGAAKVKGCHVLVHELHGTGTPLGDPLELEAIRARFGESIVLQALKTNVGHLEGSAGIAGLLKQVALCGQVGHIATPNLHLRQLNPEVRLAKDAKPVLESMPYVSPSISTNCAAGESKRIFSVSSFGFGGSNAFALVQAAQSDARVEMFSNVSKTLVDSRAFFPAPSAPLPRECLLQRAEWMTLQGVRPPLDFQDNFQADGVQILTLPDACLPPL